MASPMSSERSFFIRWGITAVAVAVAVMLVPGIEIVGSVFWTVLFVSGVLGLVSATIGTLVKLGAMGCIVMTLGFMNLIINAGLLLVTESVARFFGFGFYVNGFWPAFWGGVIISIVSMVLGWFIPNNPRAGRPADGVVYYEERRY